MKNLFAFFIAALLAGCSERAPSNDAVFQMGNKCQHIPTLEELKTAGYSAACNKKPVPGEERAR